MNNLSNNFFKENRIKKNGDFLKVLKTGSLIKENFYLCRYIKNELECSRLGVVVKKKLLDAVNRNYEKRVLREFFRLYKNNLKDNYDIVITVIDGSGTFLEKKESFERILLKIR